MIVDTQHVAGEAVGGRPSPSSSTCGEDFSGATDQVAEHVKADALTYAPIMLSGGWSGTVLVKCQDMALLKDAESSLPTMKIWRGWLDILVRDSTKLPGCKTLKCSDSVEVLQAQISTSTAGGQARLDAVCKRTRPVGMMDRATNAFRPSRARRNFDRALMCLNADISTAVPLALIERRSSPRAAWLVSRYLHDVMDLDCFALRVLPRLNAPRARSTRTELAQAIAEFLARFQRAGLHHRDLKASNVLISNWDLLEPWTSVRATTGSGPTATGRTIRPSEKPATRVSVVDLDGLARRSRWRPDQKWQPLVRLAASLIDYKEITRTDYARCLREYLSKCDGDSVSWRKPYRRLARMSAAYARRSQRRKSGKIDGYSGV